VTRSADEESARHQGRLAERASAAAYGTVLVLAALAVAGAHDVASGYAAELVGGVGLATWVAHVYATLLGAQLRQSNDPAATAFGPVAIDGLPILAATLLPAFVLLLGRLGALPHGVALWLAIALAIAQLIGTVFVIELYVNASGVRWRFILAAVGIGVVVVLLVLALGH
jgi:hypothetical protein